MRDKHQTLLRDRVDLLGSVQPADVRGVSSDPFFLHRHYPDQPS